MNIKPKYLEGYRLRKTEDVQNFGTIQQLSSPLIFNVQTGWVFRQVFREQKALTQKRGRSLITFANFSLTSYVNSTRHLRDCKSLQLPCQVHEIIAFPWWVARNWNFPTSVGDIQFSSHLQMSIIGIANGKLFIVY